jgi:hypothetical protein
MDNFIQGVTNQKDGDRDDRDANGRRREATGAG